MLIMQIIITGYMRSSSGQNRKRSSEKMKIYTVFPVELGKEFRYKKVKNFKSLVYELEKNKRKFEYHKTEEEHAHDASQIDYANTSVDKHLKYQNRRISRLVLGHNGDGVQELTDSRVAIDGE